jgi:hypothetical protein
MRALRFHAGKESVEIENEALMGAAGNELDFVDRLGLEHYAAPLHRDDSGFDTNPHAKRGGLEMLDREPSPNAGLTGLELLGNRANGRGFEPLAEDGGCQDRDPGIFEPVRCMLGSDYLLEAAHLAHADFSHEFHSTGHPASMAIQAEFEHAGGAPLAQRALRRRGRFN